MATIVEQQYHAELLRQRVHEEELARAEDENQQRAEGAKATAATRKKFPVSTLEAGLGFIPAAMIDGLEALGGLMVGIPLIGVVLAGASAVVWAIASIILFTCVGLWLLVWKRVNPISKTGVGIYARLGLAALGNTVFNAFPVWIGFFAWLFIKAYIKNSPVPTPVSKK